MAIEATSGQGTFGVIDPHLYSLPKSPVLDRVEITGILEGGLIECRVPLEVIDYEEVPVKEDHVQELAKQMRDEAEVRGGTGQRARVQLGLIEGQSTLKIIDGFHREAAVRLNGHESLNGQVTETTWDQLYDQRIFDAKDHAHVRFSRVVQWVREVWGHSGLPDQMTVEQAVLLYRFDTSGAKLGLNQEDAEFAKTWVQRKEGLWGMAAMTIHTDLKIAEAVDPALVHATRQKESGHRLVAPTQSILKVFSDELPNNFALQNLAMDVAKEHNLKGPQVKALSRAIKNAPDVEAAIHIIRDINWSIEKPVYADDKERQLRRAHDPRFGGALVLSKASEEIASVSTRVGQSFARGEEVTPEMRTKVIEAQLELLRVAKDLFTLKVSLEHLSGVPTPTTTDRQATPRPAVSAPNETQAKTETAPQQKPKAAINTSLRSAEIPPQESAGANFEPKEPIIAPAPTPESVVQRRGTADDFGSKLRQYLTEDDDTTPPTFTSLSELSKARRILMDHVRTPGLSAIAQRKSSELSDLIEFMKKSPSF